jgi:hypothetical protein
MGGEREKEESSNECRKKRVILVEECVIGSHECKQSVLIEYKQ